MSGLLNQQEQEAVERFTELITSSISPNELANILDNLLWRFTFYMLQDPDIRYHPSNADELFWAKELQKVLKPNTNL